MADPLVTALQVWVTPLGQMKIAFELDDLQTGSFDVSQQAWDSTDGANRTTQSRVVQIVMEALVREGVYKADRPAGCAALFDPSDRRRVAARRAIGVEVSS